LIRLLSCKDDGRLVRRARRVFFIRNLGFIKPTESRRISFEDALRFERVHEETYHRYGFECAFIAPGSLSDRVDAIKRAVSGALAH
jgi:predicted ATPase